MAPPEERGRLSNPAAGPGCNSVDVADAREAQPPLEPMQRSVQRRLDGPEIDRLVTGYQRGQSLADLATEFRLHRRTVAAHLEARGVPRRVNQPKMTQVDIHDAARRHQAGESLAAIARSLEVDPSTVRRALNRPQPGHNP